MRSESLDPYNFSNGAYGIHRELPTENARVKKWYLTGAFAYMKDAQLTHAFGDGQISNRFRCKTLNTYRDALL